MSIQPKCREILLLLLLECQKRREAHGNLIVGFTKLQILAGRWDTPSFRFLAQLIELSYIDLRSQSKKAIDNQPKKKQSAQFLLLEAFFITRCIKHFYCLHYFSTNGLCKQFYILVEQYMFLSFDQQLYILEVFLSSFVFIIQCKYQ